VSDILSYDPEKTEWSSDTYISTLTAVSLLVYVHFFKGKLRVADP
jgi:hypothetical protein